MSTHSLEPSSRGPRSGAPSRDRPFTAVLMGLAFASALLVRLVYLFSFRDSPYFAVPIVDAAWHDTWAWEMARGTWSMQGEAFFRAPLYPFWLSLVFRVFGHDLLAARVVQAVLGAGAAAALAGCGRRLGGAAAGVWTGLIASLYGPMIFFDGELLIPSLLVALLAWAFFFLLRGGGENAGEKGSTRSLTIAFFLLGLAAIARPNALVLVPLFAWYAWRSLSVQRTRRPRAAVAAMLVVSLFPAGVVTLMNAKAEGSFVFIASQGGVNFYAGNNPIADGRTLAVQELSAVRGSWADFVAASRAEAEKARGRKLTSAEVSRFWSQKAWRWIRSSPIEALGLTIKKAAFTVNSRELPNNRDLYAERPFPLGLLLWNAGWFSFPWGIVFPLAAAGAAMGLKNAKRRRAVFLLGGAVLLYGLSLLPFFICARFRMGMVPPTILLAALALSSGKRLLRPAPIAAFAVAFLLSNHNLFAVRAGDATQEAGRRGAVLIAAGRLDEAKEILESAIESAERSGRRPPYLADYAYHLGDAYAREGRPEDAARWFKRSLDMGGETTRLLVAMGRAFAAMARPGDAAEVFGRALEQRPQDAGVWGEYAASLAGAGRTEEAIGAYRRAVDLSPDNPMYYNGLGMIYQREARLDSAIAVWKRGAARAPGSFALHFNLALAYSLEDSLHAALDAVNRALEISPGDSAAAGLREEIREDLRGAGR